MADRVGTHGSAQGIRRQVKRAPRSAFSPRKQERFFQALAQTANIARSAKHAKVSVATIFRFRREVPGFAARYAVALEEGVARAELLLLEQALGGPAPPIDAEDEVAASPLPPMSNGDRLRVVKLHREEVNAHRANRPFEEESDEAFRAGFERKLREMRMRLLEIEAAGEGGAAGEAEVAEEGGEAGGGGKGDV